MLRVEDIVHMISGIWLLRCSHHKENENNHPKTYKKYQKFRLFLDFLCKDTIESTYDMQSVPWHVSTEHK